jgi:importin-4
MDKERFLSLLENALKADTSSVKEATALLRKEFYPNPESLIFLLKILTSHENPQLRQLAATQARTLVPKHWRKSISDGHKPEIRSHLLQSTLHEQESLVRHAEARVIAAIARIDTEDGEWAELPSLMQQAAVSSVVQEREVSTYILFTILESMGDGFTSKFRELFTLFSKTIQDPESVEVQINTMLALSRMALILDADDDEESLESMQKILPAMVSVLKQVVEAGDEERTLQGFTVFQTLLESDSRLLNKDFANLVRFMASLAAETSLIKDARTQALNYLVSCVIERKLKFQALRVGDQVVGMLMEILVEAGDSGEDVDDEFSLTTTALTMLSIMSSSLPPSQVIVPLLQGFKKYSASPEPIRRQAAITALGACVDGAPEFIDSQMGEIMPMVLNLLDDANTKVREAATSGTKLLADSLSDTMGKEHQKFIGALARDLGLAMQGIEGPEAITNASIVVHCCTAIDSLVAGLDAEDIKHYLPDLVPHISRLFTHPDIKIKSAAIGAVGAIAECAKDSFNPYFEQTMNALSGNVRLKDGEDEMDLRAMTIDAMGNMANAVGPAAFKDYVQPLMEATEEGLHLDSPRLKETSYMFWGTIAKVYKEDFKPFLPGVVKGLIASLEQEEDAEVELGTEAADLVGQEVTIAGKRIKIVDKSEVVDSDDSDVDVEELENDSESDAWEDIAGISAIAEEKEIALEAMAEVMVNAKADYIPYLEKSIEVILSMVEHPYESTRRAAISTLYRAYATVWQLQSEEAQDWQPGLPLKVKPGDEIMKLGEVAMTATLGVWMEEEDRYVSPDIHGQPARFSPNVMTNLR